MSQGDRLDRAEELMARVMLGGRAPVPSAGFGERVMARVSGLDPKSTLAYFTCRVFWNVALGAGLTGAALCAWNLYLGRALEPKVLAWAVGRAAGGYGIF